MKNYARFLSRLFCFTAQEIQQAKEKSTFSKVNNGEKVTISRKWYPAVCHPFSGKLHSLPEQVLCIDGNSFYAYGPDVSPVSIGATLDMAEADAFFQAMLEVAAA
jgi:hypothetical protein